MQYIDKAISSLVYGWRLFTRSVLIYRKQIGYVLLGFFLLFLSLYAMFIKAPHNFPTRVTITIPEGSSLQTTAEILKEKNVVSSAFLYKVFNVLSGNQSKIQAGDYYFNTRVDLFEVTARVATGNYGLTIEVVRVPEGSTIFDIGEIMANKFDKFDKQAFIDKALKDEAEGYLFPDTYQFLPNVNENKVYEVLRNTFEEKVASTTPLIEEFGQSFKDVIIMASIIEKESSHNQEERRIISGILWNRIDIGMALQVDAVFPYINGKNTYELSTDDLQIDSPYNTYKYPGLPIGPISNPSLNSIIAAVTPIDSDYIFYLHDYDGNVHYSVNFEQHKQNKFKYLR